MREEPPLTDIKSSAEPQSTAKLEIKKQGSNGQVVKKDNRLWKLTKFSIQSLCVIFLLITLYFLGTYSEQKTALPSFTVEEQQAMSVRSLQKSLPRKNNPITTWIGVEAVEETLIYTLKMDIDSSLLTQKQKKVAFEAERQNLCFPEAVNIEKLVREGFKYKHIFLDQNDIVFQTNEVNVMACGFD